MEIKTLRKAIEFSPDVVVMFLLTVYNQSDDYHKALIKRKFRDYFTREGEGITEPK